MFRGGRRDSLFLVEVLRSMHEVRRGVEMWTLDRGQRIREGRERRGCQASVTCPKVEKVPGPGLVRSRDQLSAKTRRRFNLESYEQMLCNACNTWHQTL